MKLKPFIPTHALVELIDNWDYPSGITLKISKYPPVNPAIYRGHRSWRAGYLRDAHPHVSNDLDIGGIYLLADEGGEDFDLNGRHHLMIDIKFIIAQVVDVKSFPYQQL